MQPDFWKQRWQQNQIGFHLTHTHPLLVKHFSNLALTPKQRIFLPLCGKTLDIVWLLTQGITVVAIELSEIAIKALFSELALTPQINQEGAIKRYTAPDIEIFVGDFFALSPKHLGTVDAVYDRAALVALPPAMRKAYAMHLMQLCPTAQQLLISFDYDQTIHAGPPFSVPITEIKQLYAPAYSISLIESMALVGGLKGQYPANEEIWLLKPFAQIN